MKNTGFTCDICGKNITNKDVRYIFKKYKCAYMNFGYNEPANLVKVKTRLDMCENCYKKFCEFVNEGKREDDL